MVVDQLKVSKLIKNYLLSISNETQDNFKETLKVINQRTTEEVFKQPLQSSNLIIKDIIKDELDRFIDKLADTLRFYSKGIFYSGKIVVKKRLKLKIDKTKKYDFTHSDSLFIENYLTEKLSQFEDMLKYASVGYTVEEIILKIREQWNIETDSNGDFIYKSQELIDDELDEILNIVLDTVSSIYDEVLETSIKEMIMLFKRGQIEEYRNLNINKITIRGSQEEGCCNVCKTRSNNVLDIDSLTNNFDLNQDIIHPFCKITIDPVINYDDISIREYGREYKLSEQPISQGLDEMHLHGELKPTIETLQLGKLSFYNVPIEIEERINKLYSKIRIFLSDYIKPLEFHFINDITEDENWFNDYKHQDFENDFKSSNKAYKAQDELRGSISSYKSKDKVLISNFALLSESIENMIIREIFRDINIQNEDWWKSKFEDGNKEDKIGEGLSITKSVFVNYLSRQSVEDFILESIVFYVNNPASLRGIDEEVYYKIKEAFNGIQFF